MGRNRCPNCGKRVADTKPVCPRCGCAVPISPARWGVDPRRVTGFDGLRASDSDTRPGGWECPACGRQARERWERCPWCGSPFPPIRRDPESSPCEDDAKDDGELEDEYHGDEYGVDDPELLARAEAEVKALPLRGLAGLAETLDETVQGWTPREDDRENRGARSVTSAKECPVCGRQAQPGWRTCPWCGSPLPGGAGQVPANRG